MGNRARAVSDLSGLELAKNILMFQPKGAERQVELPPSPGWKLYMKNAAPLPIGGAKSLPKAQADTGDFFDRTLKYFDVQQFENLHASRMIKPPSLSDKDIRQAVGMQKFEPRGSRAFLGAPQPTPRERG